MRLITFLLYLDIIAFLLSKVSGSLEGVCLKIMSFLGSESKCFAFCFFITDDGIGRDINGVFFGMFCLIIAEHFAQSCLKSFENSM